MAESSPEDEGAPPIRKNTEAQYRAIVRSLEKYSERKRSSDLEDPPKVSMDNVIDDLCARTDISADTKKTYRAAFLWAVRTSRMPPEMKAYGERRLEELKKPSGPKPKNAPSVHKSTIPVEDMTALEEYLGARYEKSVWSQRTLLWVQATDVTGLRTIEWLAVEWDGKAKALRVQTAKVKAAEAAFMRNRRKELTQEEAEQGAAIPIGAVPEPRVREIPLPLEADQGKALSHLAALENLVPKSLDPDARLKAFGKYYHQCKSVFTRACLKLFGERRYSLGTFRGQYSANMRSAHGSAVTATLMGHSGPDSPSAAHYGKANQAHPAFKGLRPKHEPRQGEGPAYPAEG